TLTMVMSRLIRKAARSRAARISGLFRMAVGMTARLDDPTAMRPLLFSVVDMNLFSLPGRGGPCRVGGGVVRSRFWTVAARTLADFWTEMSKNFPGASEPCQWSLGSFVSIGDQASPLLGASLRHRRRNRACVTPSQTPGTLPPGRSGGALKDAKAD